MSVLFAGVAALLLLVALMEEALAQDAPKVTGVTVRAWESYSKPLEDPYGFAAFVEIQVDFDKPIVVTGAPQVALQIGSQRRYANYEPTALYGLGWVNWGHPVPIREESKDFSLIFMYYVQAADLDLDGITLAATGITLNGGTIKSVGGEQDARVRFSAIDFPSSGKRPIKINGSLREDKVPDLGPFRNFNVPKSGDTYKRGEKIMVSLLSQVATTVTGKPQVALQIGTQKRQAVYDPVLSTPRKLVFAYVVQAGDSDNDAFGIGANPPANALTLNGGEIVIRGGTTRASTTHLTDQLTRGPGYMVDGSQIVQGPGPTPISAVFTSSPADGETYYRGEEILVTYTFDHSVEVTGTPLLELFIGTNYVKAAYDAARSKGKDRQIVFSYSVQPGDHENDGYIEIGSNYPLSLNGGRVASADGVRDANIFRGHSTGDHSFNVDGGDKANQPPVLSPLREYNEPYRDGIFRLGEEMLFEVYAEPPVTVIGTPRLQLLFGEGSQDDYIFSQRQQVPSGQTTRYADYDAARSQPDRLIFSYTVRAGDYDDDGIIAPNAPIRLNGGSIVEQANPTNHADLSKPAADGGLQLGCGSWGPDSCKVDGGGGSTNPGGGGTNPGGGSNPEPGLRVNTVRLTGTPASGETYRLGEQIQAAVTFTEAVTVTGTPQLGLTIGSQTRQAVYDATQSKGTLVVFSYYVQATDADADGISIAANALTLNGGTITLASASTTAAALAHAGVGTDDTRRVDGSTDVVEHGNSRAEATLVTLTARPTGGVGETGQEDDFRVGVATGRGAEVAGALEAAGDVDYFRVEVAGAGTLTVETTGRTDTVGALEGAAGQALTEAATGGTGTNFRVERLVQAGTYYVKVEGAVAGEGAAARQATGAYTLAVRFTPARGETTVGSVVPPPGASPPADGGAPANGEGSRPASLRLNAETAGTLQQAGEVDYFRVEVEEAGTVVVEASGAAAPAAYFGAGGGPLLPQGAAGEGARAAQAGWPVTAGTYHVAVVGGATRTQTGAYTVAVRFTAASEAGPLRATLLNVAPAHAWVHFYCGRAQGSEAAECTAQVQCGQHDGPSVAWDVTVAPETIISYWPERRAADGTAADFAAALVAAGQTEEAAGQRTTCRVFSPDPLEVRAYTQVAGELVPVASPPAPLDVTAPTRVATLLNVAPAQAYVHLACRKTQTAEGEPVDPCQARLQCGQQEGMPVAWEEDVAAETTLTYGPGGTADDLATALVAAGKTEAEARRRTTCQVFSRDPLDAWAYTRVGGNLVSVANPPAPADAGAPTRVATLLNVAPAHAWVHFYCRKAHDPAAESMDPCNVRLQCGQRDGAPVAWDVEVAPETIFTYWPDKRTADGTPADFAAALIGAGKTEAEARRRTTCQVFSTDPVDVRAYTQVGGAVVPVANPPVMPAADAPTRIGTLLNLSPAHAWVHFYCRKAHRPAAETADPCSVQLQCGQKDGAPVAWDVEVASETIFSYWPGGTAADGTPGNLAAALVAAGKPEAEAQRRTTCQVFSTDPVDVRGYTQLDETIIPVKN